MADKTSTPYILQPVLPGVPMDPQVVPTRVVDKKIFLKHHPVPHVGHRLHDLEKSPLKCSGSCQSALPEMSPPNFDTSPVTVQHFKGVLFKPKDFKAFFASRNQPQQVTQDQANVTLPLSLSNTRIDSSSHPQPPKAHLSHWIGDGQKEKQSPLVKKPRLTTRADNAPVAFQGQCAPRKPQIWRPYFDI